MSQIIKDIENRISIKQSEIDLLKKDLEKTVRNEINSCSHSSIVEAPYISHEHWDYTTIELPFRVCLECGFGEEGWCYSILKDKKSRIVKEMDRKDAYKYIKLFKKQE